MIINENLYYSETKNQKKRYLENCRYEEPTREVIDRWFCASQMIESQEETDLVNFNRIQVIRLYKSFNSKSKHTLVSVSSYFNDYYNWCISEGYIDTNNFMNYYDVNMVKSIIDEVIPVELAASTIIMKEDIENKYLQLVQDPVNKFVLYAPFCGAYGEEAVDLTNLRYEDIDKEQKVAHLISGKTIEVDDLFIKLANDANSATKYMPMGENEVNNSFRAKRYDYDESCYIIKTCDTGKIDTPISYKTLITKYNLIQKQAGNRYINGGNLYKSGLINFVKEKFEDRGITLKKALFDKKDARNYTYSKDIQKYITDFGSNMNDRMLRMRFGDFVDLFE